MNDRKWSPTGRPLTPLWDSPELPEPRTATYRNGLPESEPYVYRRGEAEREHELEAKLSAARVQARGDG